jgi:hypothetical protein
MLETGAGIGPARGLRPTALQAAAFDHSTIPLRGCSCTGCDGGTRSHTFGLMRTALLPLKLRRKDRGAPGSTRTSVCGASIRRYCLLSYECKTWSSRSGSNRRSPAYKADALASSATGAEKVVNVGADSGIRIRGLDLGTVALFHLSYARKSFWQPRTDSSRGLRFWRPPCFQLHHGVVAWYTVPVLTRFLLLEREASCR